ncbi:MAG TPA: aldo/keto reductase, partial [Nitrososphaerales archaeon]|nr:aldo/keto reductase [Nitrososphaerales archaeon]
GPTGVKVSQFALGAWHLPGSKVRDRWGVETVDRREVAKIVRKAFDAGVNFVDTANVYHGRIQDADPRHTGNSEKVLGEVLRGYDRDSMVLATKVRGAMASWPNGEGLSQKHILWQARESLTRLQTDYVDLYQIHWPDPGTPKLETLRALNHLIGRGQVRYIGSSNHSAAENEEFMQASEDHGLEGFVTLQELYNIIERGVEKGAMSVAKKHGLAVLAYSPIAQGVLSGKYLDGVKNGTRASYAADISKNYFNRGTEKAVRGLSEMARQKGVSLPQLALAWLLHKQEELGVTIIPLLGITNPKYLEDSLGSLDVKLSPDEMRMAEETASEARVLPW